MRTIEKKNNRLFFSKDLKDPGNFAGKIRSDNPQYKFILENSQELKQLLEEKLYLFSWDEIPGNDNGKLIEFLKHKFGIDWAKRAEIEKIDSGNTIKVSTEKNNLSINLNQDKNEVIFKIDDDRTDKFIVESENGKLNIYEKLNNPFSKSSFNSLYEQLLNELYEQLSKDLEKNKDKPFEVRLFNQIDWVKRAEIEKIDSGNTIKVYTEIKNLSLNINKKNFKIDDIRTDKLIAKMENGKLNIGNERDIAKLVDCFQDTGNPNIKSLLDKSPKLIEILNEFRKRQSQLIDELNNILRNPYLFDKIIEQKEKISIDNKRTERDNDLLEFIIYHEFITDCLKKAINKIRNIVSNSTETEEHNRLLYFVKDYLKEIKEKPLIYENTIDYNRKFLENSFPKELGTNENNNAVNIKTIWFNAWKYDKEDVLWRALIMRILDELKTPEKHEKPKHKLLSWRTVASIVLHINNTFRHSQFNLNEIDDSERFIAAIQDELNPISKFIKDNNKLDKKTRKLLEEYDGFGMPSKKLMKNLANDFSLLLKDRDLFDKQRFSEVHFADETKILLKQKPKKNKDLAKRNRKLLNEAYLEDNLSKKLEDLQNSLYQEVYREEPGNIEFKTGRILGATVKLGLAGYNPLMFPDAIKDFSESIQQRKRIEHVRKIKFKEEFQYRFEEIIRTYFVKRNKRVVIFIDDLDRCLPEKALQILEAIKTFLDVEGCIFVLGINPRGISEILKEKYKDLTPDEYIEKIIQLSFQLPPIEEEDIKHFIYNMEDVDQDFYKPYLDMIVEGTKPNPRKIKRVCNLIELQRRLDEAINPNKNEKYYDEEIEMHNSLIVFWAIISNNHHKFRDKLLNDENRSIFIQTVFNETMKDLPEEKDRPELITENPPLFELINTFNRYIEEDKVIIADWNSIPGNENEYKKLIAFLDRSFDNVDWAKKAYKEKDENETLEISDGKNILTLNLNDYKDKLNVEIYGNYLFCWDDIKNNNNKELKEFLDENNIIDLEEKVEIRKTDDKTVKIRFSKNSICIELDEKQKKVSLKIDDVISDEFKVKKERGKINVYNKITDEFNIKEENGKLNIYSPLTKIKETKLREIITKVISLGHGEAEIKIEVVGEKVEKVEKSEQTVDEIKEAKTKNISIERKNWREENLEGEDLSGMELNHADFSKAILTRATMKGVKLNDATLTYANLEHSDLTEAELNRAKLTRAKLNSAILNKAELKKAKLNNAKLWYAQLNEAHLEGAILKDAELYNASLEGAHLTNANLYNTGLIRATLKGAKFNGAILHHCNLNSAFFDEKTDFIGADIDSVTIDNLKGSNWRKAKWDEDVKKDIENKYGP